MNDELEPEILSYSEFRNRQTLLAWEQRRRAFESEPSRDESARSDLDPAGRRLASDTAVPPQRRARARAGRG